MSKEYRKVAKELNVHYLFGRWGFTLASSLPGGGKSFGLKLVPLDGWSFDPHEIIESFANDPEFSIKYKEK